MSKDTDRLPELKIQFVTNDDFLLYMLNDYEKDKKKLTTNEQKHQFFELALKKSQAHIDAKKEEKGVDEKIYRFFQDKYTPTDRIKNDYQQFKATCHQPPEFN